MTNQFRFFSFLFFLLSLIHLPSNASALPAFPGAEGMGADSVGGREGEVFIVDTLSDDPEQGLTFREAVEATGKRIVVFKVSGVINLTEPLIATSPYLTIAGQSSPGGICISGGMFEIRTHDIIVTHMRFRLGSHVCDNDPVNDCDTAGDAVRVMGVTNSPAYNIIFDHCSMSWGCDETIDNGGYNGDTYDVTYSWCLIAEGLDDPAEETNHGFGMNIGSHYQTSEQIRVSLHHNYIAHFRDRVPYVVYDGFVDMRNNIVYNWGNALSMQIQHVEGYEETTGNFIHNYTKAGPLSNPYDPMYPAGECFFLGTGAKGHVGASETRYEAFHMVGNLGYSRMSQGEPEWRVLEGWGPPNVLNEAEWSRGTPFATTDIPVTTTSMSVAYVDAILNEVGATVPSRDSVDTRFVNEYYSGEGGTKPDMHYPTGWPTFPEDAVAPDDLDEDGMADSWEQALSLNTNENDSAEDHDQDGYTNIEEYLYYLATNNNTGDLTAPQCIIISPSEEETYDNGTNATITLSGTTYDDVGVSLVEWTNQATSESGTATGTTNWSVVDIALVQGDNIITITATDGSGKTSQDQITVSYASSDQNDNDSNSGGSGGSSGSSGCLIHTLILQDS